MARRRNAIFHRFSRMRGLPPDEKMLMQRIGRLMDAALNNRQASNPFEPSKNNPNRVLYPPTGLVAYTGYRTLKLTWTAAASDQHLRYEVKITNNETGVSETKSTYTNELRYKNVNGAYTAVVSSVGRDGSSSPSQTIVFTMGGSVMQIEGSKNGPTELGTIVQDHITLYNNYSVYAWGSVVLDKFIAGASNEPAVFRLWSMEGANQIFDADEATLEQTITLYAATEAFSNLDANAHAALITRPVTSRPGSFETSQSVMFSPIAISTSEEDVTFTFFLQAVGRETEQDEVNLSLVLWGGFDGLGDNVPQDTWVGDPDYVFPHLHSLRLWRRTMNANSPFDTVTAGSWYMAQQPKVYNIIDNAWTLAFWVRLESQHIELMVDDTDPDNAKLAAQNIIFRRNSYNANSPWNWDHNAIEVSLTAIQDNGQPPGERLRPFVNVTVFDADGVDANKIEAEFDTWTFGDHGGALDEDDESYLWADADTEVGNFHWQFFVICYEGGPAGTSLTPKIRVYTNNREPVGGNPDDRFFAANMMECLNQRVADGALVTSQLIPSDLLRENNQDLTDDYIYTIGIGKPTTLFTQGEYQGSDSQANNGTFTIHQMGMWNVALDNWDGMGFNPGVAEQRDSSPWYAIPWDQNDPDGDGTDGRHNPVKGSSLTAIHYLFNQGYGTDIDWKKNSNERIDGAREYIFAENLVHLWQFGAVPDVYSTTANTLRDTGNHLYRGDVNFLRAMTTATAEGASTNSWCDDCELSDIFSPVRVYRAYPWATQSATVQDREPPVEWLDPDLPNWTAQIGIIQPAGHVNGAGYSDAGTTAHTRAYPGQGPLVVEALIVAEDTLFNVGWRRPNVTNGVLDEPKTYGPVYASASLEQAETDTGQDPWP